MSLEDKLGSDGDAAYAALMAAHEGLSEAQSHRLNARLILMMMNDIGDLERIKSLLAEARAIDL